MKRHYCDITGCKEEAYNLGVQICTGWKISSGNIRYEPFEIPIITTKDLCNNHFDKWCKVLYKLFYKNYGENEGII